jgi:hypothetical protein
MYIDGNMDYIPQDVEKGKFYLRESSFNNHSKAMQKLASILYEENNIEEGLWFESMAMYNGFYLEKFDSYCENWELYKPHIHLKLGECLFHFAFNEWRSPVDIREVMHECMSKYYFQMCRACIERMVCFLCFCKYEAVIDYNVGKMICEYVWAERVPVKIDPD